MLSKPRLSFLNLVSEKKKTDNLLLRAHLLYGGDTDARIHTLRRDGTTAADRNQVTRFQHQVPSQRQTGIKANTLYKWKTTDNHLSPEKQIDCFCIFSRRSQNGWSWQTTYSNINSGNPRFCRRQKTGGFPFCLSQLPFLRGSIIRNPSNFAFMVREPDALCTRRG